MPGAEEYWNVKTYDYSCFLVFFLPVLTPAETLAEVPPEYCLSAHKCVIDSWQNSGSTSVTRLFASGFC